MASGFITLTQGYNISDPFPDRFFFATLNCSVVSELPSVPHTKKSSCPSTTISAESDGMFWEVKDRFPSALTKRPLWKCSMISCIYLSELVFFNFLFHLEGELFGVVWGKRKNKRWENKKIVERTKSSVNSKAPRLETEQNHCPTGSQLQIPMPSLLKRTVQNFFR